MEFSVFIHIFNDISKYGSVFTLYVIPEYFQHSKVWIPSILLTQ